MTTISKPFCNLLAREKGLDPAGYAGVADIFVTFELPLPWPYNLWESDGVPEEVRRLIEVWYGDPSVPRPRLRPLVVAPDPATSRAGFRRVLVHRRPAGPFADFSKDEYLLPERELGPFVWALLLEPDGLPAFALYREAQRNTRDFLVCTHGAVDAACAKFGFPLFQRLSKVAGAPGEVRVRRVSHFGGHVFAPTLLELPAGRYWAYLDGDKPDRLVARSGNVQDFYGHYRGWSGLETSFLQAAEREVWMREGWGWLELPKRGLTLAQDEGVPDEPAWAEVRLEFTDSDGSGGAYDVRVELGAPVETRHSTGDAETYPHPQYTVTKLERTA